MQPHRRRGAGYRAARQARSLPRIWNRSETKTRRCVRHGRETYEEHYVESPWRYQCVRFRTSMVPPVSVKLRLNVGWAALAPSGQAARRSAALRPCCAAPRRRSLSRRRGLAAHVRASRFCDAAARARTGASTEVGSCSAAVPVGEPKPARQAHSGRYLLWWPGGHPAGSRNLQRGALGVPIEASTRRRKGTAIRSASASRPVAGQVDQRWTAERTSTRNWCLQGRLRWHQ